MGGVHVIDPDRELRMRPGSSIAYLRRADEIRRLPHIEKIDQRAVKFKDCRICILEHNGPIEGRAVPSLRSGYVTDEECDRADCVEIAAHFAVSVSLFMTSLWVP